MITMDPQTQSSQQPFDLPTPQAHGTGGLHDPGSSTSNTASNDGQAASRVSLPPRQSTESSGSGLGRDSIEQAWIERTQNVLRNFASDPFQLSKEFGALRTEYIKHRYGKTVADGSGNQDE